MTTLSREDLLRKVGQYRWAHSIDLGEGVITQGMWGRPNPLLIEAFNRIDFRGKKVLDIGCWDGLWSFEAEKRGASVVYATDDISQRSFPEQPTFALAHDVLQSKVKYIPNISVYDIRTLGVQDFDVVVFSGIYYHLKNPLLALAILRQVMATGAILIVEGPVIDNSRDSFATFFYHDEFAEDVSNWWVPTLRCLREWIECSYFEMTSEKLRPPIKQPHRLQRMFEAVRDRFPNVKVAAVQPSAESVRRCVMTARAVCRKDRVYELPEVDLAQFDVDDPD